MKLSQLARLEFDPCNNLPRSRDEVSERRDHSLEAGIGSNVLRQQKGQARARSARMSLD
jgi:hypothetical protein